MVPQAGTYAYALDVLLSGLSLVLLWGAGAGEGVG